MKRSLGLVGVSLLLGACGGDDDTATSASTPATPSQVSTATAPPGGPVTVDHAHGSTMIASPPQRIVSLDTQWTDVLTALEAPLVGAAVDSSTGGLLPWQPALAADVEAIEVADSIPFEAVAALAPDLIVITYALTDPADYDRLSQVAPTIPLLSDEQVDAWQDIAAVAGDVLGRPDDAAALVADAEQRSADLLADLPGLVGATYAFANYVPGDAIYVVADPDDGAGIVFGQLGMEIDPELLALADGATGRFQLSLEQIDQLDADVLLMLTNGTDPADIPGFANLPAVQDGAVFLPDLPVAIGLNTPTPLSIAYVLDQIRPALEAAAT